MSPLMLFAMARWVIVSVAPVQGVMGVTQSVLAEDDACHNSKQSRHEQSRPECGLNALQRDGQSRAGSRARLGESATKASRVHAPKALFWERLHPAPEDHQHELIFTVKQLNKNKLHDMLLERSTPGSPTYRRWLSRKETLAVTRNAPSMAALHRVLKRHGVTSLREVGSTFLRARAPVGVWRRLLDAQFFFFRRADSRGREVVRAVSYLLPDSLFGHVDGILKLLQLDESPAAPVFRSPAPARIAPHMELGRNITISEEEKALGAAGCTEWPCPTFEGMSRVLKGGVVTPDKLRAAYNVPPVADVGSQEAEDRSATSQLIFASLDQYWSPSDRQDFQMTFDLPRRPVSELDHGARGSNERCISSPGSCAEANLDVQYMDAMSPWSNLTLFYMDLNGNQNFDDFVVDLLDMDPMPHVISISYGQPEIGATADSVLAFDTTMLKLGLQGGTVVVASGDDGAAGPTVRTTGCILVPALGLQVSWPASSAYVTAVGATMGVESGKPEVVCSSRGSSRAASKAEHTAPMITSGGGFSNIERTPHWQAQHVPVFSQGRGVPDVSLAGHAYAMVVGGKWITVDGTSASAPAFAGMVSMINAERKARGDSLVGFLNPMLYANAGTFNDVTEGDNKCASIGARCCGGYEAAPGWDAASGLGVPDFGKLFTEIGA